MKKWHTNLLVAILIVWVYMYTTADEDKETSITKLFGDCGCGCRGKVTEIQAFKTVIIALSVYIVLTLSPRRPQAATAAVIATYFIFRAINTR